MTGQFALPFDHRPGFAPEDFLADPSNADALTWLAAPRWPSGRLVLWGDAGCGKTHLLHVWAARTGGVVRDGAGLRGWPVVSTGPLAIDDADQAPEEPLLHLLNAAAEAGRRVLLAGRAPALRWPTRLPDLRSRLHASASVGLRPPDDRLLRTIWARLLADRQMAVPAEIGNWLLERLPRSPAALRDAVIRLDHAAWGGRRITRAVAAEALAAIATDPPSHPAARML